MLELTAEKKKIIEDHFSKMLEAHTRMYKMIDEAVRSSSTTAGGNISILEQIKVALTIDKSKLLHIPAEDMLDYSKMWFENTRNDFNMIMQISGEEYSSLQKQIDEQLVIAKKEVEFMQEELKDIKDDTKKTWLSRKIDELTTRSW